jgi:metal-sulfur cluster biosynthetic enzyme
MSEEVEKYEIVGETPIEPAQIFEQLRDVYDPEIPVNIVDLGLVYNVRLEENSVDVLMTPEVMADVEDHLRQVAGVELVNVTLTFDPPWTPEKMTEDARWELGIG